MVTRNQTEAGQALQTSGRSLDHKMIRILAGVRKELIIDGARNHMVIQNPASSGGIVFIGNETVETAGVDDVTYAEETGFPLEESMTLRVDCTEKVHVFAIAKQDTWVAIMETY